MGFPSILENRFEFIEQVPSDKILECFHVRDRQSGGRDCMLRLLPARFSEDESLVEQFHRFFSRFSTIANRTHIPAVYSVSGAVGNPVYALEEFVSGVSLSEFVERRGTLSAPVTDFADILTQVCEALHHAHQKKIFHLCVTPADIRIERATDKVKLVGFGTQLLGAADSMKTLPESCKRYIAPELMIGTNFGAYSDVYSLAAVIREVFPELLDHDELRDKAISENPIERYQRIRQLEDKLRDISRNPQDGLREERPAHSQKPVGGLQPVLRIITTPAGATVKVDGRSKGVTTPTGLIVTWNKGMVISIEKPGYKQKELNLTNPPEQTEINLRLMPTAAPSSIPAPDPTRPPEIFPVERRIASLLEDSEKAEKNKDWRTAIEIYEDILMLSPERKDVERLLQRARKKVGLSSSNKIGPRWKFAVVGGAFLLLVAVAVSHNYWTTPISPGPENPNPQALQAEKDRIERERAEKEKAERLAREKQAQEQEIARLREEQRIAALYHQQVEREKREKELEIARLKAEKERQLPQKPPSPPTENYSNEVKAVINRAMQGKLGDQTNMGYRYFKAKGVPEDYAEGVKWWAKAAEGGNAIAQANLGQAYMKGHGVSKDAAEAVKWFRKGAEKGNAWAQNSLGLAYASGSGVYKDDSEAIKWYRKAADQAHPNACDNLGMMYEQGRGVAKDEAQAVQWYRKAAAKGDPYGQAHLGTMYVFGRGVKKNESEGISWVRKSADQGNAHGQSVLGFIYEKGLGLPKDESQAVQWYRRAADQGYSMAQTNLGYMYATGRGVAQNYAEAVRWYRKAVEQGDARAELQLGRMCEKGRGVAKDRNEAIKWYRKAAQQGNDRAKDRLRILGMSFP
jgi:uncharacterized protein